jgi:aminopeptidase N
MRAVGARVSTLCVLSAWSVAAFAQQAPSASPPDPRQPVVERYEYVLILPDTGKHLYASALARLATPPAVDTVVFDLDDAMRVTEVAFICHDEMEAARWVRAPGQVKVVVRERSGDTTRPVSSQTRCIRVRYDGEPADGLIVGKDAQGRWQAFGDNFPNRARFWLASMDHPSRKAKVTFRVIAPVDRAVVANGALVEEGLDTRGRRVTTWREDRPIPTYGMVIAAGPLAMLDLGRTACGLAEDGGCVPQAVWFANEGRGFMPGAFARAGQIVEFFARTIGPYPYEKLGHLQSATRYGGMENPSAIFYFDRGFRRAGGIDDGLIAHETAHQWFGDAVTEREWAHVWLSEGFATFFAALWAQHVRGDTAYTRELADMRAAVLRAPIVATHAVIDSVEADPNKLLNENSYPKGGLVLAMLRDELGDSAFFGGLRRYYAAHRHGNAMTQDLQRALEDASGRPLDWFFDQWLRRPGWAELRTSFTWNRATQRVSLTVGQGARFGAYRLTLPIEVVDAGGARRTVRVAVDARASQTIVLPGTFATVPATVRCAGDHTLLAVCTPE